MMAPRAEDDWHPLCTAPTITGRLGPTPTCAAPLRPATSCKNKKNWGRLPRAAPTSSLAHSGRAAHLRRAALSPQTAMTAVVQNTRGQRESGCHHCRCRQTAPPLCQPRRRGCRQPAPPPPLPTASRSRYPSPAPRDPYTQRPRSQTQSRGAHLVGGGGRGVAGKAALARVGRRGTRCPRQALVQSSTPAGLQAGTSRGGELVDAAARARLAQRGKAPTR